MLWKSLLQQLIVFASGQQETSQTIILKIRHTGKTYRLPIFRFFTCPLHVAQKARWMYCFVDHCRPSLVYSRPIDCGVQYTLIDTPGHAIGKQCRSRGLAPTEMSGVMQAHIPETVRALYGKDAFHQIFVVL